MEGHTWIYVITILVYLWHLSKVFDGNRQLMLRRSRIHEPNNQSDRIEDFVHELRKFKRELKLFRVRSFSVFFVIPLIEVLFHFVLGEYQINGLILSGIFLLLFFTSLMLILYAFNGKEPAFYGKKYTKSPDLFVD